MPIVYLFCLLIIHRRWINKIDSCSLKDNKLTCPPNEEKGNLIRFLIRGERVTP